VKVRPINGADDAYENELTTVVTVNSENLVIGLATQEEIDAVNTGSTTAVGTGPTAVTPTAESFTKTALATSTVEEAVKISDDSYSWSNDEVSDYWFFKNADYRESLYGYRFDAIDIPAGATVTSASITFSLTGAANQTGEIAAYIAAEQTAAPLPYPLANSGGDSTTEHTLIERNDITNRTNEIVAWNSIPGNTTNPSDPGGKITTPDLTGILNELVNLPAWAPGNSMSFLVSPQDNYIGSISDIREVHGAAASGPKIPVLTYTYEESTSSTLQTTVATSTSHVDEFKYENNENLFSQNTTNEVSTLFHVGGGKEPRRLALRFPNIDIPVGATITSANLILTTLSDGIADDPETSWTDLAVSTTVPVTPATPTAPSAGEVTGPAAGTIPPDVVTPPTPDPVPTSIPTPVTNSLTSPVTDPNLATTPTTPTTGTNPTTPAATMAINIDVETQPNPAADTTNPIEGRAMTNNFVAWQDIPETDATEITSPGLDGMLNDLIQTDTWAEGNTISMVLSVSGNYFDDPNNVRRIMTSSSAYKPVLDIRWEPAAATVIDVPASHTTAIRFRNVHVPPGATIKDASISMHAGAVNGEVASFDISGEIIANSPPLVDTNNDIGRRNKTTARATWPVTSWDSVGNKYETVDVTSIITEITGQADWCGGNPLTMFIKGTGSRFAKAVEVNATEAPTLSITYAPDTVPTDGYCSNSSLVISAADGTDDAVENSVTGTMKLKDQPTITISGYDFAG